MPLRRMVRASRTEIPSTASITASLDVNSIASLSWKMSASELIKRQIRNDVVVDTIVANFAARPLLAPSSLATLTLVTIQEHSVSQLNELFLNVAVKSGWIYVIQWLTQCLLRTRNESSSPIQPNSSCPIMRIYKRWKNKIDTDLVSLNSSSNVRFLQGC